MKSAWNSLANWLDHRTGIQTLVRRFFSEEIPASSGWRQVFGSVALFLFLVQGFTGVLLALNYAPTPGDAYHSLRYILTEVTGGKMIRSLHHWGASMIVVVVVLHMIQAFLYGAYKKPREATWLVGSVLLLVTLAYGLTGYLLPWDNRAYWGTVVVTQIAAQAPLVGPYLTRLLGGGGAVGVVTFARFFGVHVLLLPLATIGLIGLHVYLVRKHGVAPVPGDERLPPQRFYPAQVFKDTLAIFVAFVVLFTLAVTGRVPLEQSADPSDNTYIPRPEWYFLFLFQMLKAFNGPLEALGTVVLPGAAVLVLILAPFIDRGRMVKVTKRTVALTLVALGAVTWTGLTAAAVVSTPKPERTAIDYSGPTGWLRLAPEELANPGNASVVRDAPVFAIAGALVYQANHCGTCHTVNGVGNAVGPSLNELFRRRSRIWVERHFAEPGKFSPKTIMPVYNFSARDRDNLTSYLFSLEAR